MLNHVFRPSMLTFQFDSKFLVKPFLARWIIIGEYSFNKVHMSSLNTVWMLCYHYEKKNITTSISVDKSGYKRLLVICVLRKRKKNYGKTPEKLTETTHGRRSTEINGSSRRVSVCLLRNVWQRRDTSNTIDWQ